jgi:signal transduction histidine kinase
MMNALNIPGAVLHFMSGVAVLIAIFYPVWVPLSLLTCHTVFSLTAMLLFAPAEIRYEALFAVGVSYVVLVGLVFLLRIYINKAEKESKRARDANHAKNLFLANMSHEIRTPLTGIIGFTHILSDRESRSYEKQLIGIIHDSGQQLLHIVNDILDYSSLLENQVSLEKQKITVREFCIKLKEKYALECRKKGLEFYLELHDNVPEFIFTDKTRVQQILDNLLTNAVKFTDVGSVILTVSCPSRLLFHVMDTGRGIPKEALSMIFEQFYQLDSTYRKKKQGKGLGLSISKKLAEILGGDILVESREKQGSRFTLTLPVR